MSLLTEYEGAIYYFDKSYSYLSDENYDDAMESLTKGYKIIRETPLISDTKSKYYTEIAMNKIQNEEQEESLKTVQKIRLIVEVWQKNDIIKSQDN